MLIVYPALTDMASSYESVSHLSVHNSFIALSMTHSTDEVRPFNETRQQAWFNAGAYSDTDTNTIEPSDLGLLSYVGESETDGQIF